MAGPDKQFDRLKTLKKAQDIFWAKGFAATSMQDLVNGMGINRASMYQTYGNKQALYSAVIDQYMTDTLMFVAAELSAPEKPLIALQKLLTQFIATSINNKMSGCLVNNAAVELGPYDKDIAKKARHFWSQFEKYFAKTLELAVEKREVSPNMNPERYAALINTTLQGLMVKSKSSIPKKQLLDSLDMLFAMIKQCSD